MARRTLIDFFEDAASIPAEFLTYDDGYRTWSYRYAEVGAAARAFAARLDSEGIGRGHTVAIWAENRPEWIIAFWGCLLNATILVPIDYRASAAFLSRVADIVDARVLLVGEAVDHGAIESARPIWSLVDLRSDRIERRTRVTPSPEISADDTAEIIFTSGATADPKGVVITHRNILANIVPIEREMAKYRKYMRPFLPIRFLNLLPLSHMFGQAMATFVPPMLPGLVAVHPQLLARGHHPADSQPKDFRARVRAEDPGSAARSRDASAPRDGDRAAAQDALGPALVVLPSRPSGVRSEVLGVRRWRGAARSRARNVLGASRLRRRTRLRADGNGAHRDA